MDGLLRIDIQLFSFINHLPHTPFTDAVALSLSGAGTAGIIWFIIAVILFLREEKKNHWFFLPILLAGGISGIIVNNILKPLVARARPDEVMGAIVVGKSLIHDYSFPSGHATMSFAAAVVLSRTEPKWRIVLYLLAALISLSRIFLGKHYPLDVAAGALLGWGIGASTVSFIGRILRKK